MGFFETSRIISFHQFRSAREGRISIQPDGNYVGDVIRGSAFCENENLRSAPVHFISRPRNSVQKYHSTSVTSRPKIAWQ